MTMSSADPRATPPIGDDRLALLRSLLLCQLAECADRAAESHAVAASLSGEPDVDSLLERELAETSATHFDAALYEARAALRRIDAGTFGVCEACEMPIPYERLEALPHARRCVDCPDPRVRTRI